MKEGIVAGYNVRIIDRQSFQVQLSEYWIQVEYNPKENSYTVKGCVFEEGGVSYFATLRNPNDKNFMRTALTFISREQHVKGYLVLYE